MDQCKPLVVDQQHHLPISFDINESNNLANELEEDVNSRECNSVSLVNRDYDISKLKYLVGLNLFNR